MKFREPPISKRDDATLWRDLRRAQYYNPLVILAFAFGAFAGRGFGDMHLIGKTVDVCCMLLLALFIGVSTAAMVDELRMRHRRFEQTPPRDGAPAAHEE